MADSNNQRARTFNEQLDNIYAQAEAMLSASSISSMATASDNPGAGRTLGKLISFLGRHLETASSRLMEKRGYGPLAVKEGIMAEHYLNAAAPAVGSAEDKRRRKKVARLLTYAKSHVPANRELAYEAIVELVTANYYFHQVLSELDAAKIVGLALLREQQDDSDDLLSPSRKALICLVDTKINSLGSRALDVFRDAEDIPASLTEAHDVLCRRYFPIILELIDYVREYPDASFLAMRYIHSTRSFFINWACAGCHEPFFVALFGFFLDLVERMPSAIEWPVFMVVVILFHRVSMAKKSEGTKILLREVLTRSLEHMPSYFLKAE
ncbi:hypothetical protein DFH11DRAFT_1127086 [Phellopilus nigrolimitatus]|nr:hypothetical protein DFH11DRAFT_1127086 [Phellopilus nigrolimitatus]